MNEKIRKVLMVVLTLALICMIGEFWLFVGRQAELEKQREEELAIEAMYVELGTHGEYLFVQEDTETPFEAEFPDGQVFDEHGKALKRENISSGDVFKIYGNGAMTMSYPGQYPGVTKMIRVKWGTPEDAKKYDELLEKFRGHPIFTEEEGILPPESK